MTTSETNESENEFTIDSFSVQTHITVHQSIIARMATNSMNCKTWCISLVSAIIALGVTKESWHISAIAILPLSVFWFLDAYYLKLEKTHRLSFDDFVKYTLNSEKIFVFESASNEPVWSRAVAPFYIMQVITIILIIVYFIYHPPTT